MCVYCVLYIVYGIFSNEQVVLVGADTFGIMLSLLMLLVACVKIGNGMQKRKISKYS